MSLAIVEAHNFLVWFPIGELSKSKIEALENNIQIVLI
jgi:hypothetical protein